VGRVVRVVEAGSILLTVEVLAASLIYKLARWHDFVNAVHEFAGPRWLMRMARPVAPIVVPLCEAAIISAVLVPATRRGGLVAAVLLVVGFTAVVAIDKRDVVASCGCWGATSLGVPRRALLARNGVLVLIALAALAVEREASTSLASRAGVTAALLAAPFVLLLLELPTLLHVTWFRFSTEEA